MYRLIIAEDEIFVRIGLEHALDWAAHQIEIVASVSNGREALDAYRQFGADIVITDIKMPVMDGMEFIQEVRRTDSLVKFIILTCVEEFAQVQKAIQYGVSCYFTKYDMDMAKLEEEIGKICGQLEQQGRDRNHSVTEHSGGWQELEEYFLDVHQTEMPPQLREHRLKDGKYCLAVLEIRTDDMDETLHASLVSIVNQLLQKRKFGVCLGLYEHKFVILYRMQKAEEGNFQEQAGQSLQYLSRMLYSYFSWRTESRIGGPFQRFEDIQEQFLDLNDSSKIKDNLGKTREVMLAIQYIREHLHENITLQNVAQYVNFSEGYLSYVFKQQMEVTFSEFVQRMRIRKAKLLLAQTEDKLYAVAEQCGFQSAGYFDKVFKRVEGVSPGQYRRSNRREK